jgi:hypothetical protein
MLSFFMGRLIFINRFFHPDHSATSQLVSDLASHLAQSGRDVHVITSRQIYDNPRASLPVTEIAQGVHVHRVFSTRFGRFNLLGRGIDYLSFYVSVWRQVLALAAVATSWLPRPTRPCSRSSPSTRRDVAALIWSTGCRTCFRKRRSCSEPFSGLSYRAAQLLTEPRRILVTGGVGYIGSHACKALAKSGTCRSR